MANISKAEILEMLSSNLMAFFPNLREHFMCPTCLTVIPLEKKEKITEAHIIPRAAGGTLKTYLCNKCNSLFGRKQDKWFGERLKLARKKVSSILATDIKEGRFWIDDIKVNGAWKIGQNNELAFFIHKERNSPEVNKLIKDKFGSHPPEINMRMSIPIIKHRKQVEIGFLTAGYLMWFGALGYSWVLQDHLNPIREQISNPEKNILKTRIIAYFNELCWKEPWFGLVTIADEIMLTMGLEDCMIFFPPADRPEVYSKLGNDFTGYIGKDFRPLEFWKKPYYGPPVSVMFDNRVLVAPNASFDTSSQIIIHFSSFSDKAKILGSVSKEKFEKLEKTPGAVKIHPDFTHELKEWKLKKNE